MVLLIKITINAFAYNKGNQKFNTYGYTDNAELDTTTYYYNSSDTSDNL